MYTCVVVVVVVVVCRNHCLFASFKHEEFRKLGAQSIKNITVFIFQDRVIWKSEMCPLSLGCGPPAGSFPWRFGCGSTTGSFERRFGCGSTTCPFQRRFGCFGRLGRFGRFGRGPPTDPFRGRFGCLGCGSAAGPFRCIRDMDRPQLCLGLFKGDLPRPGLSLPRPGLCTLDRGLGLEEDVGKWWFGRRRRWCFRRHRLGRLRSPLGLRGLGSVQGRHQGPQALLQDKDPEHQVAHRALGVRVSVTPPGREAGVGCGDVVQTRVRSQEVDHVGPTPRGHPVDGGAEVVRNEGCSGPDESHKLGDGQVTRVFPDKVHPHVCVDGPERLPSTLAWTPPRDLSTFQDSWMDLSGLVHERKVGSRLSVPVNIRLRCGACWDIQLAGPSDDDHPGRLR